MGTSKGEQGSMSWTTPGDIERLIKNEHALTDSLYDFEHTDEEGTRVVVLDGRLSLFGRPSSIREDGTVAIGVDLPAGVTITLGS